MNNQLPPDIEKLAEELERRNAKPKYSDYVKFFESSLGGPKKDLLSGELLFCEDGTWQSAFARLDVLGSLAIDSKFYLHAHLQKHLARFASEKKAEFIPQIPKWDGEDRLRAFANCIEVMNCSQETVYQLLCDWGSKLFQRLKHPSVQNRLIVLKGPQGIGKDSLIDAMVGSLGQFAANISVFKIDDDTLAALGSLAVARISEFDRTSKTCVSTIKDLITRDHYFIRLPYDRAAKRRSMRSSFIATVNVDEILRDPTGNRRFVIFDINDIRWDYPRDQSLQVLAQFKELSNHGFCASDTAEKEMKEYIVSQTPDDPDSALVEFIDHRLSELEKKYMKKQFNTDEIAPVIEDASKYFKRSITSIRQTLKLKRRSKRVAAGIVYFRDKLAP